MNHSYDKNRSSQKDQDRDNDRDHHHHHHESSHSRKPFSSSNGASSGNTQQSNGGGYMGFSSSNFSNNGPAQNQNGGGYKGNSYNNTNNGNYAKPQMNSQQYGLPSSFNQKQAGNRSGMGANLHPVDFVRANLLPFQKNFYRENPNYKRTNEEIELFRKQKEITITKTHQVVPPPFISFADAALPDYLVQEIAKTNFKEPTPIQSQSWPILLKGNDMIGIAQTGSGKTLGYILPGVIHLNAQPPIKPGDGPICLVLAPTRELAVQIQEECEKFGTSTRVKSTAVYGGVEKYTQKNALKKGADILVATPGRLIDFLETGVINLMRVSYLVLDEADRMLDMGFEPQIRKILSQVRPDRQTCMWSATWPKEVKQLALDFCKEPVHLQIGSLGYSVNPNIVQNVELIPERMKSKRIVQILQTVNAEQCKTIIFCQTKKGCEYLNRILKNEGWRSTSIHGDKEQKERDYVLEQFKQGHTHILVATDVAARGLDVKDIKYVVNYDFPNTVDDYIHRIGRTGRGGASGVSYTFFTEDNEKYAGELVKAMKDAGQVVSQELQQLANQRRSYNKNRMDQPNRLYENSYNKNQTDAHTTYKSSTDKYGQGSSNPNIKNLSSNSVASNSYQSQTSNMNKDYKMPSYPQQINNYSQQQQQYNSAIPAVSAVQQQYYYPQMGGLPAVNGLPVDYSQYSAAMQPYLQYAQVGLPVNMPVNGLVENVNVQQSAAQTN